MFHYGPSLHFLSNGRRLLVLAIRTMRPLIFFTIEALMYGLSDWETNVPTIIATTISNILCSLWILLLLCGKTMLAATNLENLPLPGIVELFTPFSVIAKHGLLSFAHSLANAIVSLNYFIIGLILRRYIYIFFPEDGPLRDR